LLVFCQSDRICIKSHFSLPKEIDLQPISRLFGAGNFVGPVPFLETERIYALFGKKWKLCISRTRFNDIIKSQDAPNLLGTHVETIRGMAGKGIIRSPSGRCFHRWMRSSSAHQVGRGI
jgi:hypothetical protein